MDTTHQWDEQIVRPRLPTETELMRIKTGSMVPGFVRARFQVIPVRDMVEGDQLIVSDIDPSVKRSISRMFASISAKYEYEQFGSEGRFKLIELGDDPPMDRGNGLLYKRDWDRLAGVEELRVVRARRESPDGVQYPVGVSTRGKETVRDYPWDKMTMDGDFFIVAFSRHRPERIEERNLKNAIRETATRRDWEIQITKWKVNDGGEEVPGLRVTRIRIGLAALKKRLNDVTGKHRPISNGRKRHRATVLQSTLDRKAIQALVTAGIPVELATQHYEKMTGRLIDLHKKSESGWASMPDQIKETDHGIQGQPDTERPGRSGEVRDIPAPVERGEETAQAEDARHSVEAQRGVDRAGTGGMESRDIHSQEHARLHPEPVFGPPLGELEVDEDMADVLVVDTSEMTAEQLKGSAYSPDYDRAAIMRERLRALGVGDDE